MSENESGNGSGPKLIKVPELQHKGESLDVPDVIPTPDAGGVTHNPTVKRIPMPGGGVLGRRRLQVAKQKAVKEFKEWRAELVNILKRGCKLEFNPDGSYGFLIAPRIVKLVWASTIKERIKMEISQAVERGEAVDEAEIRRRAMVRIRQEVEEAQVAFLDQMMEDQVREDLAKEAARAKEEKDQEKLAQEEADAAQELSRMREEMIKEKEDQE